MITLLFGFISILSTYAASPAAIAAKNVRQKFVEAVMNAEDKSDLPTSGEVEVLFTITDEGTVDIKKLKSTNEEIEKYVKEKIISVPCNDFVHPFNQYYKVKFIFSPDKQ
jgi:hypothetical protein